MKKNIKLTITLVLIVTGLLFSCKKQDGYSDEVQTNQNSGNTATETVNDSIGANDKNASNGSLGTDAQPAGAQSTGSQSLNAGDANSGGTGSANSTKSTGTGSGPGPSAKDGAAYAPSSDPKQNPKRDTIKKANKNKN